MTPFLASTFVDEIGISHADSAGGRSPWLSDGAPARRAPLAFFDLTLRADEGKLAGRSALGGFEPEADPIADGARVLDPRRTAAIRIPPRRGMSKGRILMNAVRFCPWIEGAERGFVAAELRARCAASSWRALRRSTRRRSLMGRHAGVARIATETSCKGRDPACDGGAC